MDAIPIAPRATFKLKRTGRRFLQNGLIAGVAADSEFPLIWLASRRSVWVLGDPSQAPAWHQVIADLMNVTASEIVIIELRDPSSGRSPLAAGMPGS